MSDPASNGLLVLRKPTGTIQVTNPFNLGEQKLLNALMCHAQSKGLAIGERHEIGLDRLYPALGWSASKNIDRLKDYLRVLLGTVVDKYLRRDVLGPAVADVNAHSNIDASFERVVERRKTVAVAFEARYRSLPTAEGSPLADFADATGVLTDRLVRHGVSPHVAKALCARHSASVIIASVRLLETAIAGDTLVANPGAWLRRAIEQGWATIDGAGPPETHGGTAPATRDGGAVREAFERHRRRRSREAFAQRSKTFRTRRRNAFVVAMEAEGNRVVLDALARDGWENAMVDACLFGHGTLMDDLLIAPHERDIDRFVMWRRRMSTEAA